MMIFCLSIPVTAGHRPFQVTCPASEGGPSQGRCLTTVAVESWQFVPLIQLIGFQMFFALPFYHLEWTVHNSVVNKVTAGCLWGDGPTLREGWEHDMVASYWHRAGLLLCDLLVLATSVALLVPHWAYLNLHFTCAEHQGCQRVDAAQQQILLGLCVALLALKAWLSALRLLQLHRIFRLKLATRSQDIPGIQGIDSRPLGPLAFLMFLGLHCPTRMLMVLDQEPATGGKCVVHMHRLWWGSSFGFVVGQRPANGCWMMRWHPRWEEDCQRMTMQSLIDEAKVPHLLFMVLQAPLPTIIHMQPGSYVMDFEHVQQTPQDNV